MNYQREREEFFVNVTREGLNLETARAIVRNANTIQRLSVAECDGDYPCDNGERKVQQCSKCESGYVRSVLDKAGVCPNCRAQRRIESLLAETAFKPEFQGDPRGCCVQLVHRHNEEDGRHLYVPTRRY